MRDSALAFLAALDPNARSDATFPLEAAERAGRINLIRSLDATQRQQAVLYPSLRADTLTEAQRHLLGRAIGVYLGWSRSDHAAVRTAEVDAYLDETWFSWLGGTGDDDPFYYRIHNPVVLIEFDQHPGVAFDNTEPSRHHIHTHRSHAQRRRLRHGYARPPPRRLDHSEPGRR